MTEEKNTVEDSVKLNKSIKEKVILLAIGTVVTVFTFLVSSYAGNFVTFAKYNEDKAIWSTVLEKIDNIEDDIKEIKENIKN